MRACVRAWGSDQLAQDGQRGARIAKRSRSYYAISRVLSELERPAERPCEQAEQGVALGDMKCTCMVSSHWSTCSCKLLDGPRGFLQFLNFSASLQLQVYQDVPTEFEQLIAAIDEHFNLSSTAEIECAGVHSHVLRDTV